MPRQSSLNAEVTTSATDFKGVGIHQVGSHISLVTKFLCICIKSQSFTWNKFTPNNAHVAGFNRSWNHHGS